MSLGSVIIFEWRASHSQRACTSLRLKAGWTSGSGHGPQCGTWAPMSGSTNENTSRTDIFIVETSLCRLQKNKIDSHPLNVAFLFRGLQKMWQKGKKKKKTIMAISNGGVKSMICHCVCKETYLWSTVFTYKLKITTDCGIVSFKTKAFPYL